MKTIKYLALALVITACGTNTGKETSKAESNMSKTITFKASDVQPIVDYLASDELQGRHTGTSGIDAAATYIENQFKAYNVKPYFKTYRNNFKAKTATDTIKAFNVVGFIEGSDKTLKNEVVVIGAHYDHIGIGKAVANDSVYNGANDNATGTAAVLAMAKYFKAKNNNKRSIVFALFSAEEMGLQGSRHLANQLKNENLNIYTVVNFEMLGVPFTGRDYEVFVTGFEKSNMAEKINNYTNSTIAGFSEVSKKYTLFKRSDNYPFHEVFNIPSHTISSCDLSNFDEYHKVGDEVSLMDYGFLASIINKLIPAVEQMTNTPTKDIVLNGN